MISKIKSFIVILLIFNFIYTKVFAAPMGSNVVHGNASIHQSGANTTINQNSDKVIINWDSFNVNKGENVHFNQNAVSNVILNRVTNGLPSSILGNITGKGNIFIVNKAGVIIGNGASINTGSFLASSGNITDKDFINNNYRFTGASGNIINNGSIKVRDGGYAVLMGRQVKNNGLIAAKLGKVYLSSGDTFRVDLTGDDLIGVAVEKGTSDAYILNSGNISAEGSLVVMTANNTSNIIKQAVNNTGVINASSLSYEGGKVILGASNGEVINTGKIDVSSETNKGGSINITGTNIINNGTLNANGINGGVIDLSSIKYLEIGKNSLITSNAYGYGNGGIINLISKDRASSHDGALIEAKSVYGKGGNIELSGHKSVFVAGDFDTSSIYGSFGLFIIDPSDMFIGNYAGLTDNENNTVSKDGNTYVDITWLKKQLGKGNVELKTVGTEGSKLGNITLNVATKLDFAGDGVLTLNAANNIDLLGSLNVKNVSLIAQGDINGTKSIINNGSFKAESKNGSISLTNVELQGTSTIKALNGNISLQGQDKSIVSNINLIEGKNVSIDVAGNITTGKDNGIIKADQVTLSGAEVNVTIDASKVLVDGDTLTITNKNEGEVHLDVFKGNKDSTYTQNTGVTILDYLISENLGKNASITNTSGTIRATDRLFDLIKIDGLKLTGTTLHFIENSPVPLKINNELLKNMEAKKYAFTSNGNIFISNDITKEGSYGFDLVSNRGSIKTEGGTVKASYINAEANKNIELTTDINTGSFITHDGNIVLREKDAISINSASALRGTVSIELFNKGNLSVNKLASNNPINIKLADASAISLTGTGETNLLLNITNATKEKQLLKIDNLKDITLKSIDNKKFKEINIKSQGNVDLTSSIGNDISADERIILMGANINGSNPLNFNTKNLLFAQTEGSKKLDISADNIDISGNDLNITLQKAATIKDLDNNKTAGKVNNLYITSKETITLANKLEAENLNISTDKDFIFDAAGKGLITGSNINITASNNIGGVGKILANNVYMQALTIGADQGIVVNADKGFFHATDNEKTDKDIVIDINSDSWYDKIQNYVFKVDGKGKAILNGIPVDFNMIQKIQDVKGRNLNPAEALNINKASGDDLLKGGRLVSTDELVTVENPDLPKVKEFIYKKNNKTEIK